jgi:hypothetical protein
MIWSVKSLLLSELQLCPVFLSIPPSLHLSIYLLTIQCVQSISEMLYIELSRRPLQELTLKECACLRLVLDTNLPAISV